MHSVQRATAQYDELVLVLSVPERLQRTLCHEMCHAAVYLLDRAMLNVAPHGYEWQQWVSRALRVYPDMQITTRHSYDIEYKFRYQCSNHACAKMYVPAVA